MYECGQLSGLLDTKAGTYIFVVGRSRPIGRGRTFAPPDGGLALDSPILAQRHRLPVARRCRSVRLIGACLGLGIGVGGAPNEVAGQSEPGAIEGLVLDIQGLVPLARAVVVLNGGLYQTLTNAGGEYVIDSVRPGEYEIRVRRIGYEEVVAERVTIEAATRHRMDFALDQGAISLEDIEVTAAERTTPDATRSASRESLPLSEAVLRLVPAF